MFADKLSGKNADRPELAACLDYLRPGDTLVVPSLDRLSRSLTDLIQIVGTLRRHGVGFKGLVQALKGLHEALNTTTPGGRLVFHVFAALAEFIRELIVEGTCDEHGGSVLAAAAWPGPGWGDWRDRRHRFSVCHPLGMPEGMISYRYDDGAWLNAAEDPRPGSGYADPFAGDGREVTPCRALEDLWI